MAADRKTFGLVIGILIGWEATKGLAKMVFYRHARESTSPLARDAFLASAKVL